MTHVPEKAFIEEVEDFFRDLFPEAELITGYDTRLEDSGRYPDILIEGSRFGNFAVEAENDFETAFKGVGQALLYARETGYTPVLVLPEGHTEEPEWTFLKSYVHGFTLPHDKE